MGSRKNLRKEKNKRNEKVLDKMEEVYSGAWYMGKEGGFRKHKRDIGRIWREDECRGEEARKVRYDEEEEF